MSILRHNIFIVMFILVVYALAVPQRADAYLDAGTGSYLIQLVVAFVAGGLFMLKVFWQRFLSFFGRGKKSVPAATPKSETETAQSLDSKSDSH